MSTSWYLLYSKPQQERLALENLGRQGYHGYLPLIRRKRRRQSRYVDVIEPMFPRYLFIHLNDETDDWGPIRSTIGVAKLVRFGDCAARVPDRLVTGLQDREDEYGIQDLPVRQFKEGDRVRIQAGPLEGYEGIFQARNSQERVMVLLDVVGRQTRVAMSADQLELA